MHPNRKIQRIENSDLVFSTIPLSVEKSKCSFLVLKHIRQTNGLNFQDAISQTLDPFLLHQTVFGCWYPLQWKTQT